MKSFWYFLVSQQCLHCAFKLLSNLHICFIIRLERAFKWKASYLSQFNHLSFMSRTSVILILSLICALSGLILKYNALKTYDKVNFSVWSWLRHFWSLVSKLFKIKVRIVYGLFHFTFPNAIHSIDIFNRNQLLNEFRLYPNEYEIRLIPYQHMINFT